jgi:alkylhydroperoxidase family enzyme
VPNLHRVPAKSPAALEAYTTLWGIAEKTSFTVQERNVAYLAINYENDRTYCMAGHTNLSRMAKVDAATIAAVREGRPIAEVGGDFGAVAWFGVRRKVFFFEKKAKNFY